MFSQYKIEEFPDGSKRVTTPDVRSCHLHTDAVFLVRIRSLENLLEL